MLKSRQRQDDDEKNCNIKRRRAVAKATRRLKIREKKYKAKFFECFRFCRDKQTVYCQVTIGQTDTGNVAQICNLACLIKIWKNTRLLVNLLDDC